MIWAECFWQTPVRHSQVTRCSQKVLQLLRYVQQLYLNENLHFFKSFDGLAARGLARLGTLALPDSTNDEKG